MSTNEESARRPEADIHSVCQRRNLTTAEIIEKGVALQEGLGTRHAAEFFRQKMIGMDLATRVLIQGVRRAYSLPNLAEPAQKTPADLPAAGENSLD